MATTLTEGSWQGASNGTTSVEVVAAPSAGTSRDVTSVSVYNADSATRIVYISRKRSTDVRVVLAQSLNAGASIQFEVKQYLADTDSMLIELDGTVADTELDIVSNWIDRTM